MSRHVAIDLGASGGRVALGTISGEGLEIDVLHRFPNGGVRLSTGLYWDHLSLWHEVLVGLKLAGERGSIDTVGVNSWGVDYGLLDDAGLLLDGIRHYRDPRTEGIPDQVFARIPREEIYERTGIQFMPLNTLYQLAAHEAQSPGILRRATRMMMVPDLFHFWLCGVQSSERTIASTTQLCSAESGTWDHGLIDSLRFPRSLFAPIVEPGVVLGPVHDWIGLPGAVVVAPACHDTASAIAAAPASNSDWAYISSGTWSLAGIETARPIINPLTRTLNLTNEAGANGTTRLLKNITGLWILQECRRVWGNPPYEELYESAHGLTGPMIDPDDPQFLQVADDMPDRVRRACGEREMNRADITSCILNSLAQRSADILGQLETVSAKPIRTVHIVGGGSRIDLLNQLIANASGREVVAGPVDATLMGNLLLQAEAGGAIPLGSVRDTVGKITPLRRFIPS